MQGRNRATRLRTAVVGAAALLALVSCSSAEDAATSDAPPPRASAITRNTSLAQQAYRVDSTLVFGGRVQGTVQFDGNLPSDSLLQPTHDVSICKPVVHAPFIGSEKGLGDAIVWLAGVATGPADTSSRRVPLTLTNCQLQPRVQRAAAGATLLVGSRDAMNARLRFLSADDSSGVDSSGAPVEVEPRALVPLSDAGAVVPIASVLAEPGLVEVRDDHHPWVRGWIAVAPHPYVAVSNANGEFIFDRVPAGAYVLVTWHERLGRVEMPVMVEAGVETRMVVRFRNR